MINSFLVLSKDATRNFICEIGSLNFLSDFDYFNNLIPTLSDTSFSPEFIVSVLKFIVIPLFVLFIFLLVFSLVINRYKHEQLALKKREIDTLVNDFLTEIIFSSYSGKEIKEKIADFKTQIPYDEKWCRYVILNKLIHFKQNIHGFDQNQILLVYKYFGLQSYSQRLINDRRWYFKSLGIYHYQVLDYKIKKGQLKSFLHHKNKYLRSNALIATIALSDEKFGVLDNYTEKISRADELKILDIIYQKKSKLPENIVKWIYHENNSIVILALKLLIRYKEPLTIAQINHLLQNTDVLVRKEVLLAIRELELHEANETLIQHYPTESNKRNRISCLKTLGIIGNKKTLQFATEILTSENDLEIKFEIVNCINKIDKTYFDRFTAENETENNTIKKIVLHVTNPYLN